MPESPVRLLSPRLTVLVATKDEDGTTRAVPFSWVIPVSFQPPLVMVAIQKGNKGTLPNLRRTGKFTVNLVSSGWAERAVKCERVKHPENAGLKVKSIDWDVPVIEEAGAWLACKVRDILDVGGDHLLVIGEVVKSDGEAKDTILHISGERFVRIGEEVRISRHLNL
ncbi:MAG: hypothetical protein DRP12_03570 [Candidatus Aenigmatarchaeota archaeon]|nr:MAG: hypothetical protein DRP12_03570 [Candidatus Aenigmarchaeota archaeon]